MGSMHEIADSVARARERSEVVVLRDSGVSGKYVGAGESVTTILVRVRIIDDNCLDPQHARRRSPDRVGVDRFRHGVLDFFHQNELY